MPGTSAIRENSFSERDNLLKQYELSFIKLVCTVTDGVAAMAGIRGALWQK
jgi:hypothetical protein